MLILIALFFPYRHMTYFIFIGIIIDMYILVSYYVQVQNKSTIEFGKIERGKRKSYGV